jgi:hypothetical protein
MIIIVYMSFNDYSGPNKYNPYESTSTSINRYQHNPFSSGYYASNKYVPHNFKHVDDIKKNDEKNKQQCQETEKEIEYLKHDILFLTKSVADTAVNTSKELNDQGDILIDIQPKLTHVSDNLESSDTVLGIIQNKFNKFAFWRSRHNPKYKPSNTNKIKNPNKHATNKNTKTTDEDIKHSDFNSIVGHQISEKEFCDVLSNQLDDIAKTNIEIGDELDGQCDTIDSMTKTVNTSIKHTDNINRRMKRLIR